MSIILCFGKPVMPRLQFNRDFLRLVVGPVGLWVMFHDVENVFGKLLNALRLAEARAKENTK